MLVASFVSLSTPFHTWRAARTECAVTVFAAWFRCHGAQVLCGMRLYDDMAAQDIAQRVVHDNLRPQFPSWAPKGYRCAGAAMGHLGTMWQRLAGAQPRRQAFCFQAHAATAAAK